MNQSPDHEKFVADLLLEKGAVEAFIEILQNEQHALVQGDVNSLDFFASDKSIVVGRLTNYGQQRAKYLASLGLESNSAGMEELLTMVGVEAGAVWAELLRLADVAQQLNQINGTVIATRLQHSQRALAALQCTSDVVSLYGPNGQCVIRHP